MLLAHGLLEYSESLDCIIAIAIRPAFTPTRLAVAVFCNGHKWISVLPAVGLKGRERLVGKSTPAVTQIKALNGCNQLLMHFARVRLSFCW